MKASDAFKDGEPPEDAEDPEEEAKKLKFPWHCEKGIPENIRKLNDEFNAVRGLHPVKIFITGPPACGKSYYGQLLATYYNIPLVEVKELVGRALDMAKIEESEDEFTNEIKAKIEELRDAMVSAIEEARPDDAEPEEIDREKLVVRLPNEILYKLLRIRLNENNCRNRGYVLSGFPRSFKDAQYIFYIRQKKFDEEGNEIEEEEEEVEEGEEKKFEGYITDPDIYPAHVIVIKGTDDFLIERMKN